jgi:heme/copper-type cytochrome/quinol oxidase subunit 3
MSVGIVTQTVGRTAYTARGRQHPAAWWAMVLVIVTESMIFAALLSANFFLRAGAKAWPEGHIAAPELHTVSFFTVVLLGSSAPVWWAERGIDRSDIRRLRLGLAIGWVMGAAFLAFTVLDFVRADFGWTDNAYASIFDIIVGLHAIHVAVGLAMSAGVQAKAWTGRVDGERHVTVRMFSMYWHFVDAVWVAVFSCLYLSVALR